jgi:hypothetical protein
MIFWVVDSRYFVGKKYRGNLGNLLFLNNKVVNSPLKIDKSLFLMGELNPKMLTIHKGGHDSQPWRLLVFLIFKMDPP